MLVLWVQGLQLAGPFPNIVDELQSAMRSNSVPELEDSDLADDFANLSMKMRPAVASEYEDSRPPKRIRLDSSQSRSWQDDKHDELVKETANLISVDGQYLNESMVDDIL